MNLQIRYPGKRRFPILVSALILLSSIFFPTTIAHGDITLPPKGVSQELWKAYQEVVISNIDGGDRNLRWTTNPNFYIAGDPTIGDNSVFQSTLAEIGSYCNNIKPYLTSSEPGEGALFYYVPASKFKSIISGTPNDATSSYSWSLYYLNRGLTKFTAVLSTEISQANRDYATRIRILQGMGFRGKSTNLSANMFSWNFSNSGYLQASELDKQIIRLYCSNYSRSWDTSQQTFDLISSAWTKKITTPNLYLNIKVGEYKNQLNFSLNFDPSQALDNQLTGIQYYIYDSSGGLTTSGKVDVSQNLFKSYEVILNGIKDNSRYRIEAYPLNSNGNGAPSKGEGRAGSLPPPLDSIGITASDASAELVDARNAASDAIDAANESIANYGRLKSTCSEVSVDFEIESQELYDSTNLTQYCDQLDEDVTKLDAKIGALDPDKAITVDQANDLTDNANLLAEDADTYVAMIQDITDELIKTEKEFLKIAKLLQPLNNLETEVIEPWDSLQERLNILPISLVNSLKKSAFFKSASLYANQVQALINSRDTQVEALSIIEKPSQISPIANKLGAIKITTAQLSQYKKALIAINKLIPANVCQKGSAVVLASKTGKCAKGFELIPTS